MRLKHLSGLLFTLISLSYSAYGQGLPKIVIDETEHNLGEVKRGVQANYSFVFRNNGKSDLEINHVIPSCGCTATEFTKVVAPGKEGKITLSLNTSNYTGEISKTAEVYTNDPQRKQLTLMLSMVVTAVDTAQGRQFGPFIVSPTNRSVLRIIQGTAGNGVITINTIDDKPIQVTKANSSVSAAPPFAVTLNTLAEGKRYALNFATSPDLPAGRYNQIVKLTTDSKELPSLEIRIEAVVVESLSVSPTSLTFDNISYAELDANIALATKFVWLKAYRSGMIEVKGASSNIPFIKVRVEPNQGDGQSVLLRVGFSEKPPKGNHQGVLKIEVSKPEVKVFEVPITVNVQ